MLTAIVVIVVLFALMVLFLVISFNSLVKLRLQAQNAWSDIDVQLKQRYDLVPNLVETVKGYAAHERTTLDSVTEARTQALSLASAGPAARAEAESRLTTAIHGLVATVEAYPQLQASGGFRDLQAQLARLEDALSQARRYYNAVVRELNTRVMQFPTNLVAGMFGVGPREFFEAGTAERETPKVSF